MTATAMTPNSPATSAASSPAVSTAASSSSSAASSPATSTDARAAFARDGVSIGIDTGGTHTDLVLVQGARLMTLKVPSTPDDLSVGILRGVARIAELAGVAMSDVDRFVYASTLVTNLIVEEKGAQVGLITTEGFRDVLEIRRASRKPDVYDIHWRPARPLVPRHLRLTVPERMDYSGRVLTPLDEVAARTALLELASSGVTSIAVCLLHAYANPEHEQKIARIAADVCPHIDISISSEVVRQFREYERTSTTCVSAFIRGPITRHLDSLARVLAEHELPVKPYIMRGNGGICTFESAKRSPAMLAHSGPMGGIIGATALAAACGLRDIITLDMGGTSADVSLISDSTPMMTHHSHVGAHPLLVPTLDLITIGAGGGSIAWVDGGTALRVGPRSAGSVPGPACYGQGGQSPTVTDANLFAGRLNPDYFLAGARALKPALSREVLQDRIATPLDISIEQAALGILAITEAHMVNAIRLVSVERGLDPRDFTLVAFGGAGALHALRLAEALNIRSVLIPPAPGNLSAMGLLCADIRHDLTRTLVARVEPALAGRVRAMLAELLDEAHAVLAHDGVDPQAGRYVAQVDVRYQGQNYELGLPLSDCTPEAMGTLIELFHEQHQLVYGYHFADRDVQLVNVRMTAVAAMPRAAWPAEPIEHTGGKVKPAGIRKVLLSSSEWADVPVIRFLDLRAGQDLDGPAIVEYPGSTLVLPAEWHAYFDEFMNARLTPREQGNRARSSIAAKQKESA